MHKWLSTTLAVLALSACRPSAVGEGSAPIIGGTPGGPTAVGLIVELGGAAPVLRCTGTLITTDAVLTAAHCILDDVPQNLGFVASHTLATVDPAEIIVARDLQPHPLFVGLDSAPLGVGQANDLGLLLLDEAATIAPMPVTSSTLALARDDTLVLVGAGWTFAAGSADGEMHQGDSTLTELGDYELASGLLDEAQACLGDSGGAVIAAGRLVGVISRTGDPLDPCQDGTIATRVDTYLDFIDLHTTLPCGSGDEPSCGAADATTTTQDSSTTTDAGGIIVGPGGGGGAIVPRQDDGCHVGGAAGTPAPLFWLLLFFVAMRRHRRA